MTGYIKHLWRSAPIATTILAIALIASVFFSGRMVAFWIYWHDPAHREQEIAAWMTPRYISHSWQVPKEVVLAAVGAPHQAWRRTGNLTELAAHHGITVAELIAATEQAIATFRANHLKPGERQP